MLGHLVKTVKVQVPHLAFFDRDAVGVRVFSVVFKYSKKFIL